MRWIIRARIGDFLFIVGTTLKLHLQKIIVYGSQYWCKFTFTHTFTKLALKMNPVTNNTHDSQTNISLNLTLSFPNHYSLTTMHRKMQRGWQWWQISCLQSSWQSSSWLLQVDESSQIEGQQWDWMLSPYHLALTKLASTSAWSIRLGPPRNNLRVPPNFR